MSAVPDYQGIFFDVSSRLESVAIIGGAGFVGSHFTDRLLSTDEVKRLVIFDNFSSGHEWHYAQHVDDPRLTIVRGDVRNLQLLTESISGCRTVIHLASNPDIAAAATNPAIDFDQGTLLTHCVAEATRVAGVELVLYASGSGVYGELGELEADEDHGPLVPVSTYAASKLAGEALLSSYAYMFGNQALAFRFGNVVGPRQTHGVGFDFLRKLHTDSARLEILGNGTQSKSYVHVHDVVDAVLLAARTVTAPFEVFNVATLDYITVTEIARLAVEVSGLSLEGVRFDYTGGDRGWKGDVPIVRLSSQKIRKLGWSNRYNCSEALRDSLVRMKDEPRIFG